MRRGESVVQPHGWHTQALLLSREAVRTIALKRVLVNTVLGQKNAAQIKDLKFRTFYKKYLCASSAKCLLELFENCGPDSQNEALNETPARKRRAGVAYAYTFANHLRMHDDALIALRA